MTAARRLSANGKTPELGVLSDGQLWRRIRNGDLIVDPLLDPDKQVRGSKIDLRLDNVFATLKASSTHRYDPMPEECDGDCRRTDEDLLHNRDCKALRGAEQYHHSVISYGGSFTLHPQSFALGQTFECVRIPDDCFALVEGRSSLARRGLLVHITASGIDPGYGGPICLELYNVGRVPVDLRPLMRIAALVILPMGEKAEHPYHEASKKGKAKFGHDLRATDMNKRDGDLRLLQDAMKPL